MAQRFYVFTVPFPWVVAAISLLLIWGLWVSFRDELAVQALSLAVAGRVIAVDPGHGGIDPGAIGPAGTREKDITLAVAKRLKDYLRQAGAEVVMTREEDVDLSTPGKSLQARKREDLDRRLAIVRSSGAEVYLSIQVNSFGTRWTGAQTFYWSGSPEGKLLAEEIQGELTRRLRNTNRKAKPIDAYVLKNIDIPACMIEVGFISNSEEERLLNNPDYQKKLAWSIFAGLVRYLSGID